MGEVRERALQLYSREYALAHIGISSTSDASNSKHIAELVEDWGHTYRTVLTKQQREVRAFLLGNLGHCKAGDSVSCDQPGVHGLMAHSHKEWLPGSLTK